MKKIPLTQGKFALVDDEDYAEISKFKWHSSHGYAQAGKKVSGKWVMIYLHRVVNMTPAGMYTDHINGNKLDNRRGNLRTCTKSQNSMNRGATKQNRNGIKGVSYISSRRKWGVQIEYGGKSKRIGYFDSSNEALLAYNIAAKKYHGEFARLNYESKI